MRLSTPGTGTSYVRTDNVTWSHLLEPSVSATFPDSVLDLKAVLVSHEDEWIARQKKIVMINQFFYLRMLK